MHDKQHLLTIQQLYNFNPDVASTSIPQILEGELPEVRFPDIWWSVKWSSDNMKALEEKAME